MGPVPRGRSDTAARFVFAVMHKHATLNAMNCRQVKVRADIHSGPAINVLAINATLGPRKTLTFVGLVIVMAAITGMGYGAIAGGMAR